MRATALCPAHITGFFEIRDSASDPLRKGSRGAGVNLMREVETEVETSPESGIHTLINGREVDAKVSRRVAERLLTLARGSQGLMVRHVIPVPVGSGFGTSGAGAIGVAMAGSEALGLGLTNLEVYQMAHAAEAELKTGLGTVLGQFCGGLEVREKEGAPGIGTVFQIPLSGKHTVVALHNGPMLTSEFLSNPEYRKRINEIGGAYSDEICRKRDLSTFLSLAHDFSLRLGLSDQYLRVMNDARSHGFLLGMAMFGHTLFTVVRENETVEIVRLMRKEWKDGQVIVSSVETQSARLAA
ncbi:MAG: pantoate kinase [Thaumarchaeota archaeon]|nr:pantoate kinase [Nitrososphaerota archaeon]